MNAQQWRKLGYVVIFSDELVWLYRPQSGVVLTTPNDNGDWMLRDDVNRDWKHAPETPLIKAIARDCYCSSLPDGSCDFCTGTRTPELPWPTMNENPKYPNPCARCGACCVATPCPIGLLFVEGAVKGQPCPAVRFHRQTGEAKCLMLERSHFSSEEMYQQALREMGVGTGCCMLGEAVDLDSGARIPWAEMPGHLKRYCVQRATLISADRAEVDKLAGARYN